MCIRVILRTVDLFKKLKNFTLITTLITMAIMCLEKLAQNNGVNDQLFNY